MAIAFVCDQCGVDMTAPAGKAGRFVCCPNCRRDTLVPSAFFDPEGMTPTAKPEPPPNPPPPKPAPAPPPPPQPAPDPYAALAPFERAVLWKLDRIIEHEDHMKHEVRVLTFWSVALFILTFLAAWVIVAEIPHTMTVTLSPRF